ncbi:MAG: cytochrome C [Thiovulaceae bacterium]|nr:cytochrome C [Sulfurimonadaceae bacterium]
MSKKYLVFCGLIMGTMTLDAAVYKGQKVYIKKCRICHEGGEKVATQKTMQAWQEYFQNKGANIAATHMGKASVKRQISELHNNGKAKKLTQDKLERYFLSGKFQKKSRHLKDFLMQYAKDSGNVPACN